MEPLISVIIPAYNVEPYIEKCVQSVINQSYSRLEIILVDDGSTDNTGAICDCMKQQDHRIKVIHQNNQGLSAARNTGLDIANGEWIAFLDSDDWIEREMYSELLRIALNNEAEISSCKTRNCYLNQEPPVCDDTDNVVVLDSDQMVRGLRTQEIVRFEVWNKLWKRALIGDIRFKKGQVSEDVYFDRVLFLKATRMAHIDKTLHNYLIQRPGNTLSSFKVARLCIFDEFDELKEDLKKLGRFETVDIVNCIASSFAITIYGEAFDSKQSKDILSIIKGIFDKYYRESRFSHYRSVKGNIGVEIFNVSPSMYLSIWKRMYGKR